MKRSKAAALGEDKTASAGREEGQRGDVSKRKPGSAPSSGERNQSRGPVTQRRLSKRHGQRARSQATQLETKTHSWL